MLTEFEWDEFKRRSNLSKHGFDFVDVWQLFAGDHILGDARTEETRERRLLATGYVKGVEATVVFTMRNAVARIISVRRARTDERKQLQALHQRRADAPEPSRREPD